MRESESRGWQPPQKPEEWLVYLIGGAAALYIACSLPAVLGPGSLLGALGLLLTGVAIGIAFVFGGALLALLLLTKKAKPDGAASGAKEIKTSGGGSEPRSQDASARQLEHDNVVQEMIKGSRKRASPHAHVIGGAFSGWVWTMPSSKYDRAEAIINWPPATDGARAVATKWWASMRGGTLFLARSSGLGNTDLVPVEEVELSECVIEVVKDALKTKSRWWRKCPLQISHSHRDLLHREPSFVLFAEGSAAKEQWYAALKQAAGEAPARQAVEDIYALFCERAREASDATRYPQAGDEGEVPFPAPATPSGAAPAARKPTRAGQPGKGWGRLFSRRRSPQEGKRGAGEGSSRGQSPVRRAAVAAGFINPMELDQAWMGKGAVPSHLAAKPSPAPPEDVLTPAAESSGLETPATEEEPPAAAHSPGQLRSSNSSPALAEKATAAERAERLKLGSKSVHFPLKADADDAADSEDAGSERDPSETPAGLSGLPEPGSAECRAIPVEHGVNMLLARVAFDILRSPPVKTLLKARIHRKLNELRIPDYIHGFEVVDIDLGDTAPAISNLRAMPTPDSLIWPQLMFDLDYEGKITVIIETKLDVRDGAAWLQFDKAINRLEGGQEGFMEGEPGESVQLLGDSDEDVDMAVASPKSPAESQREAGSKAGAQKKGFMANMLPLRQRFAKGIRQLAEVTADHLSRMQLRLRLDIRALKGPLCVWMPPPPGDRLWFSFVTPPQLEAAATPLVGGRLLKYSYQASRVSQWIAAKLQSSITKNMVSPSCSDIPLPFLLGLDHPDVGFVPASFLSKSVAEGVSPTKAKEPTPVSADQLGAEEGASPLEAAVSKAAQAVISTPTAAAAEPSETCTPPVSEPGHLKSPALSAPVERSPAATPEAASAALKERGSGSPRKGFWNRKKSSLKLSPKSSNEAVLEMRDLRPPQVVQPTADHRGGEVTPPVRPEAEEQVSARSEKVGVPATSHLQASAAAIASPPLLNRDSAGTTSMLASHPPETAPGRDLETPVSTGLLNGAPDIDDASQRKKIHPRKDAEEPKDSSVGRDASDEKAITLPGDGDRQPPLISAGTKEPGSAFAQPFEEEVPPATALPPNTASLSGYATIPGAGNEALDCSKEVVEEAPHPLSPPGPKAESRQPKPDSRAVDPAPQEWTPAEEFFRSSKPSVIQTDILPPDHIASESLGSERSIPRDIASGFSQTGDFEQPQLSPTPSCEGVSPNRSETGSLEREGFGPGGGPRGASWQQRLNATGTVVQKNWEAFKTRNPHTMQQGKKFAGAMEKFREQAQEQIRKTQEQIKKTQEQRKSQREPGSSKAGAKEQ